MDFVDFLNKFFWVHFRSLFSDSLISLNTIRRFNFHPVCMCMLFTSISICDSRFFALQITDFPYDDDFTKVSKRVKKLRVSGSEWWNTSSASPSYIIHIFFQSESVNRQVNFIAFISWIKHTVQTWRNIIRKKSTNFLNFVRLYVTSSTDTGRP